MKSIILIFFISVSAMSQVFIEPIMQRRGTASSPPAAEEVTLRDTARYFNTNITSMSKAFTVGSYTNSVLYVALIRYVGVAGRRDTAVTWDDVNLTFLDSVQSGNLRIDMYRLINPTAKADTVISKYNSVTAGYGSMWISVWSGLNQTTPNTEPDSALSSNSAAPVVTVNNEGHASGDTVVSYVGIINNTTITDSAGQASQAIQLFSGSLGWNVSTRGATSASTRMVYALGVSTRWVEMAFALKKN